MHRNDHFFLPETRKENLFFGVRSRFPPTSTSSFGVFSATSARGTPPYPTCCYARYCFKFERALPHSSDGRGVDKLHVVGIDYALV